MINLLRSIRTPEKTPQDNQLSKKENGNIAIWVILFFPLLFATFGVSVDASLASYTRANLQSAADAATLSVVTHANNPTVYNVACADMDGRCQNTPYLSPIRANDGSSAIPSDRHAIYTGANPMFNQMYGNGRQNVSSNTNDANFTPLLRCQTTLPDSVNTMPGEFRSWGKVLNAVYKADGDAVRSTFNAPFQSAYLFGTSGSFGGSTDTSSFGQGWSYLPGDSLAERFGLTTGNGDYTTAGFLASPPSNSLQQDGNNCYWTMAFGMIVNTANSINFYVTVVEESNTIFLRMFGINTLSYYIESSARTAFR